MEKTFNRIVNIRYFVGGLRFDAAIDCDWRMHSYDQSSEEKEKYTPIELYCFDKPDWGIRMIYQDKTIADTSGSVNEQQRNHKHFVADSIILSTICNFDNILEETKKWIEDEEGNFQDAL